MNRNSTIDGWNQVLHGFKSGLKMYHYTFVSYSIVYLSVCSFSTIFSLDMFLISCFCEKEKRTREMAHKYIILIQLVIDYSAPHKIQL